MIEVNIKALRAAMKSIVDVVEARNTVPILANVLISAAPGMMRLTGTDMDIMLERSVTLVGSGKALERGGLTCCVHAKTLDGIAAKLPAGKDGDGTCTIEADGNAGIIVKAGRSRFKLPTLAVDDFPTIVGTDWDTQFEMQSGDLAALIDSVRFAISTEETRYYLNGIFLHQPGDQMIAAATDGSRLARFHCDAPEDADVLPDTIIGRKTVAVIDKLLDGHAGTIEVAISTSKIRFAIGDTVVLAKLVDGTFPDYTRVIPAANRLALWFEPKALAEAVDRVVTIATEKTRAVKMTLTHDLITLQVCSPENGIATEDVPCEYKGDEMAIGFNGAFLLDVLRHLNATGAEDGRAQALFADPAAPSLWRDSEDARRLYVLMPMRV